MAIPSASSALNQLIFFYHFLRDWRLVCTTCVPSQLQTQFNSRLIKLSWRIARKTKLTFSAQLTTKKHVYHALVNVLFTFIFGNYFFFNAQSSLVNINEFVIYIYSNTWQFSVEKSVNSLLRFFLPNWKFLIRQNEGVNYFVYIIICMILLLWERSAYILFC